MSTLVVILAIIVIGCILEELISTKCKHRWSRVDEETTSDKRIIILQCDKCGKIKTKKIKL